MWALVLGTLVICLTMINPNLPDIYMQVSITLMVEWFAIMIAYYMWAIYYYNVNVGFSDKEWKEMEANRSKAAERKKNGEPVDDAELELPVENPYKDKTFGLPEGTVRGTIALTILVVGIAMFILRFSDQHPNDEGTFSLLGEAFLMMVAFYFGTKGLELLRPKSE